MTGAPRRAVADDLDALVALNHAFCAADRHPFDERRVRSAFNPLLTDDRWGVVWIVDEPAAYAVLTWGWSIEAGGVEAVLDEIYVSQQRRGVGATLVEHIATDAASRGVARIFLETERHNDHARRFYARHGFVEDDSIWMSRDFTDST